MYDMLKEIEFGCVDIHVIASKPAGWIAFSHSKKRNSILKYFVRDSVVDVSVQAVDLVWLKWELAHFRRKHSCQSIRVKLPGITVQLNADTFLHLHRTLLGSTSSWRWVIITNKYIRAVRLRPCQFWRYGGWLGTHTTNPDPFRPVTLCHSPNSTRQTAWQRAQRRSDRVSFSTQLLPFSI